MVGRGSAGPGVPVRGVVWSGIGGPRRAWHGEARPGSASDGALGHGMTRHGDARLGKARRCRAGFGLTGPGLDVPWLGMVGSGRSWPALDGLDLAWSGEARLVPFTLGGCQSPPRDSFAASCARARPGWAARGAAGQCKVRRGGVSLGETWIGMARRGSVGSGVPSSGWVWLGEAGTGQSSNGSLRLALAWRGSAWLALVGQGGARSWPGGLRHGVVRRGMSMAGKGEAGPGLLGQGSARLAQACLGPVGCG